MKKLVLALCLLALVPFGAGAQDGRQRTSATIIADALAQLPADTPALYEEVMGEIAATGSRGVEALAALMSPAEEGTNAAFEYALSGLAAYATVPGREAVRAEVRRGLLAALGECGDAVNRAFLLSLLQVCATAEDAPAIAAYLDDDVVADAALRALIAIPGSEPVILERMERSAGPDAGLACAAAEKKMPAAEPVLLRWAATADKATLPAVYDALAACGSAQSLPVLVDAARRMKYESETTDAALRLAHRLAPTDSRAVVKSVAALSKSPSAHVRGGALQVLAAAQGIEKTMPRLLEAVRRGPADYRHAALLVLDEGGEAIEAKVVAAAGSCDPAGLAAVLAWLGGRHTVAQSGFVAGAVASADDAVARAAIGAAGKIGGEECLEALAGQLGGRHTEAAVLALASFPGEIAPQIALVLESGEAQRTVAALDLVSRRRVAGAAECVFALLDSDDAAVRAAAFGALPHVVEVADADRVAGRLDRACPEEVEPAQKALVRALATLGPAEQFARTERYMQTSKVAARYYPVLAATHTPEAAEKLLAEYRAGGGEGALEALLGVKHSVMIGVLYDLAAAESSLKDRALARYACLTAEADRSPEERYELCRRALELAPAAGVRVRLLDILAGIPLRESLLLAGESLADPETAVAAAMAVKKIAAKADPMPGGAAVRELLERSREVLRSVADADAGYAADEIEGLLERLPESETAAVRLFELPDDERAQGYEVLFDGRSLDKWQGNKVNYVIRDGVLDVSAAYGGSGNLYTVKEYGDFVLRFEFRFVAEGVNNGIGIRTRMGVDAAYEGMEIQVLDHDAPIYRGLMPYQQHGSVYGIIPARRVLFPPRGTWNRMEIEARGDRIRVTVNDEVIVDGDIRQACNGQHVAADGSEANPSTVDGRNHPGLFDPQGYICFCGHGAGIQFRDVRVRELAPEAR